MTTESIKTQSNRTIKIRTLFRWAKLVTWDLFRALVLIPSTIVGTMILVAALIGWEPVSGLLESMYENRDAVGDVAGDGLIAGKICLDTTPELDELIVTVCKEWSIENITIAEAVQRGVSDIKLVYIILLFISFVLLSIFRDWSWYESRTKP